nr:MAG TPA: hypothetical protein [Caudoviricetes sp.]
MDSYREGKLFKTQVERTRVRIPERRRWSLSSAARALCGNSRLKKIDI